MSDLPITSDNGATPVVINDPITVSNVANVKAGATAATAADEALVVTLSPNSPVPAGSNVIGHVITDTGSTTVVTGNTTVVQPTGTNLHTVVDNFPADADALAQGSATAGQLGALEMGAVTTAVPAYTTGTTRPLSLDTAGNLRTVAQAATATLTQVSVPVTQVTILAANASRKMVIFFNNASINSHIINLSFGATASLTVFTVPILADGVFVMPLPVYTGVITAISQVSTNVLNVTELT